MAAQTASVDGPAPPVPASGPAAQPNTAPEPTSGELDLLGFKLWGASRPEVEQWAATRGLRLESWGRPGACDEIAAYHQTYCGYAGLDIGASSLAKVTFELVGDGQQAKLAAVYIRFDGADYVSVANGVVAKFGPPQQTRRQQLTTGIGLPVMNEILTWADGKNYLVLERYSGSLDQGRLSLMTPRIKAREERGPVAGKL